MIEGQSQGIRGQSQVIRGQSQRIREKSPGEKLRDQRAMSGGSEGKVNGSIKSSISKDQRADQGVRGLTLPGPLTLPSEPLTLPSDPLDFAL